MTSLCYQINKNGLVFNLPRVAKKHFLYAEKSLKNHVSQLTNNFMICEMNMWNKKDLYFKIFFLHVYHVYNHIINTKLFVTFCCGLFGPVTFMSCNFLSVCRFGGVLDSYDIIFVLRLSNMVLKSDLALIFSLVSCWYKYRLKAVKTSYTEVLKLIWRIYTKSCQLIFCLIFHKHRNIWKQSGDLRQKNTFIFVYPRSIYIFSESIERWNAKCVSCRFWW